MLILGIRIGNTTSSAYVTGNHFAEPQPVLTDGESVIPSVVTMDEGGNVIDRIESTVVSKIRHQQSCEEFRSGAKRDIFDSWKNLFFSRNLRASLLSIQKCCRGIDRRDDHEMRYQCSNLFW